jgi:hypothetical protein
MARLKTNRLMLNGIRIYLMSRLWSRIKRTVWKGLKKPLEKLLMGFSVSRFAIGRAQNLR